jgi:ABC-type nitrate/sulfonate/bicarbonate transport system ATPase subunit
MIELQDVSYHYPEGREVFAAFSWRVGPQQAWSVLGPSGCGKTTLLMLLAGLRAPTGGQVLVAGEKLTRPRPKTGLILQDYGLLPWASVRENVALGFRIRGFYGPDGTHAPRDGSTGTKRPQAVEAWLERLGLTELGECFPGQISGGQRQRVAIARTLALNPDVLLMDEPFASLDAPTRESLQSLTLELRTERDLTTIIVTHAIEEAALMGSKVMLLGAVPNTAPVIFENPGAADPAFRNQPAYAQAVTELRRALEAVA